MNVKKPGDFDIGIFAGIQKKRRNSKQNANFENLFTKKDDRELSKEILPMFDRLYKQTGMRLDLEVMKRRLRV
jgi:hypothetical protein